MKKLILALMFMFVVFCSVVKANQAITKTGNIQRLQAMFTNMVVKKDISLMSKYYDLKFKLYSNGKIMSYDDFYKTHKKIYKTPIHYRILFDKKSIIADDDKVAARVFITTKSPGLPATKIEVILIAQYHKDKIYRLWELTYPNWSKLREFHSASK